ncbi:MAG: nucleotidyltransferase domain-containing protein [Citrobacter freundii]|nr:nucleotidyltransferase domain-containing protein [Citrobacter freundii]
MSATIPDSIRRQVNAASALIARIIEGDLVAVHLYGSAVEGGLKPQSDIDLLVTIRQPLNTRQRASRACRIPGVNQKELGCVYAVC